MKSFYYGKLITRFLLWLVFSWPAVLLAQFPQRQQQEVKPLEPVSSTYAITNATVYQAPGRKLDGATVVLKDGLITGVGKNLSIPPEAIIIKGDSLHVYAGFIDGLSHAGVPKPKEERRERPQDPANPPAEYAGITPEVDVRSVLDPEEKSIDELRTLGFTTAHVVPYGNMLPGSGAIVLLSGKSTDGMVLVSKSSMFSELAGAQRVYPATVIAVMAKWRELYKQAQLSKNYQAQYTANPGGIPRPATDRILEAFYPVIDKKMPVFFEADRYLDIQRILSLKADLGFSLFIGDVKEGWDAIPKIKSTGTKVFLSLDLPDDKKDDKKGDKRGSGKAGAEKKADEPKKQDEPSIFAPGEKESLEKRKAEFLALYTGQASTFQKAGVPFGFSSLSAKPADIRGNLRRMVAAGLTEDQALAALTTSPAQLLGLSDRLGSIDNGKIANLVVSDKPYFDEKSNVRYVFVDGAMFKYDPKAAKAEANGKDISGTWTVSSQTAQGSTEHTVTFKKEGASYTGSITGTGMEEAIMLENIEVVGNKLKYSYTAGTGGQTQKVDVEVTLEGDSFKGTASAGGSGTYAVEGKKNPNR